MKKNRLRDLDLYVGATLFAALVLIIIANVTLRYVFHMGLSWAEELILILFLWATYLGIVVSYRYDRHIRVDFILKKLPKPVQRFLDITTEICITVLSCYIAYLAVTLSLNTGEKKTLVMQLPANVVNISLVVTFALIGFAGIIRIIEKLKGTYVLVDPFSPLQEQTEKDN